MKNTLKAISFIVAIMFLLSSCNAKNLLRQEINEFNMINNGFIEDRNANESNALYKADEGMLSILKNQMKPMLSNEYAELYLGNFNDIALYDKKAETVFFSNYALYKNNNSSDISDVDKSQLVIEFFDNADTAYKMSSFPECIDDKGKNQITTKVDNNRLEVLYQFGVKQDERLISPAFSAKTFDDLVEKANQLKDQGKLTTMEIGRFKLGYLHLVYDALSDTEKDIYSKKYKKLSELKEIYVLKEDRTNLQKKEIENVTKTLGITKAAIEKELSTLGQIESSQTLSPYFEIPLSYSLDGRDLLVSIDPKNIMEQKTYYLSKINILGGFGALDKNENGFIFLPDQSGTIINTKNNNSKMKSLNIQFYGSDFGIEQSDAAKLSPYAPFPVFGLGNSNRSLFAIVESGEAISGVNAELSGETSGFSKANPWYSYRINDSIDLSGMEVKNTKNVYSKSFEKNPFIVRYHALYGSNSDYNGMAKYYRNYLLQTNSLSQREINRYDLELSFIGAFDKKQIWFGLQTKKSISATSFKQADQVLKQLESNGINNYSVNYFGAMNGGLESFAYNSISFEDVLGGNKGFEELKAAITKKNNRLFPVFDLSVVYKEGNGLVLNKQLSRYLNKNYAVYSEYLPSENKRDNSLLGYQISPAAYSVFSNSIAKEYKKFANDSLYLDKTGSYLNADYSENAEITREQSKYGVINSLKKLKSNGYYLKLDGANAYVLPYADKLSKIPVNHSNYMISSYSVPFVGMVLHGIVPYSGPSLNQEGNYKLALLKSIESGSELSYTLIGEDPIIFSGTDFNQFYSMTANSWIEDIKREYVKANEIFGKLNDSGIVKHTYITDDVVLVTYSNGQSILINYGKTSYHYKNQTIEGLSYSLVE